MNDMFFDLIDIDCAAGEKHEFSPASMMVCAGAILVSSFDGEARGTTMDHVHDPEDDANEERTVEKKRHWGIFDSVDRAVSGIFTPHPDSSLNPEEQKDLREENDAEQRR